MRVIEILRLGKKMRREAELGGVSVNGSAFMVHEIMLRAFADDPELVESSELQAELSARLQRKLEQRGEMERGGKPEHGDANRCACP